MRHCESCYLREAMLTIRCCFIIHIQTQTHWSFHLNLGRQEVSHFTLKPLRDYLNVIVQCNILVEDLGCSLPPPPWCEEPCLVSNGASKDHNTSCMFLWCGGTHCPAGWADVFGVCLVCDGVWGRRFVSGGIYIKVRIKHVSAEHCTVLQSSMLFTSNSECCDWSMYSFKSSFK